MQFGGTLFGNCFIYLLHVSLLLFPLVALLPTPPLSHSHAVVLKVTQCVL